MTALAFSGLRMPLLGACTACQAAGAAECETFLSSAMIAECSIIIPAYNARATVGKAIESALSQEVGGVEVIVVDDGSTDGTHRVIPTKDNVRLFRQGNRGVSAARNRGLEEASCEFVLFLDADDWLLPGALAALLQALKSGPRVMAAYGEAVRADAAGQVFGRGGALFTHRYSGDVLRNLVKQNFVVTPGALCTRTQAVREAGGFNESLRVAEDWALWCVLATLGHFVYVSNMPVVAYRERKGSAVSTTALDYAETEKALDVLFAHPAVCAALGKDVPALRQKRAASARSFIATQQLKAGNLAEARRELMLSLKLRPGAPREWILLAFALLGWIPPWLRSRLK